MEKFSINKQELFLVSTHDLIRSLCLRYPFQRAFSIVCNRSFCLNESFSQCHFYEIDLDLLNKAASFLYSLDQQSRIISSCYSISLTIFYISAIQDLNPNLVIGVTKVDQKLLSHAWVELPEGHIITTGEQNIGQMSILHKWQIKDGLDQWLGRVV